MEGRAGNLVEKGAFASSDNLMGIKKKTAMNVIKIKN